MATGGKPVCRCNDLKSKPRGIVIVMADQSTYIAHELSCSVTLPNLHKSERQVKNDPLSNVMGEDHFRAMLRMGARWHSRGLGLGKLEAMHLKLGGRLLHHQKRLDCRSQESREKREGLTNRLDWVLFVLEIKHPCLELRFSILVPQFPSLVDRENVRLQACRKPGSEYVRVGVSQMHPYFVLFLVIIEFRHSSFFRVQE